MSTGVQHLTQRRPQHTDQTSMAVHRVAEAPTLATVLAMRDQGAHQRYDRVDRHVVNEPLRGTQAQTAVRYLNDVRHEGQVVRPPTVAAWLRQTRLSQSWVPDFVSAITQRARAALALVRRSLDWVETQVAMIRTTLVTILSPLVVVQRAAQKLKLNVEKVVNKSVHIIGTSFLYIGCHPYVSSVAAGLVLAIVHPILFLGLVATFLTPVQPLIAVLNMIGWVNILAAMTVSSGIIAWFRAFFIDIFRPYIEIFREKVVLRSRRSLISIATDLRALKRGAFDQDRLSQAVLLIKKLDEVGFTTQRRFTGRATRSHERLVATITQDLRKSFPHFFLPVSSEQTEAQRCARELEADELKERLNALLDQGARLPRGGLDNPVTLTKALWVLNPDLVNNLDHSLIKDLSWIDIAKVTKEVLPFVRDVQDLNFLCNHRNLPALPFHQSQTYFNRNGENRT